LKETFMKLFNRQGRTLLVATAVVMAGFASGAVAQEALVPFVVNVNATVKAAYTDGYTTTSQVQTPATANVETILRIPLSNVGVLKGTQKQANIPTVVSNRGGKVAVNLPAQSYGNAEISLYTVNGKQILRRNVSASNAVNNITRLNIATGAYLLSVRGTDGNALTSRLTHSGGNLDIDVAFGSGSEKRSLTKGTGGVDPIVPASGWRITVSASGYIDESYAFTPVSGMNPRQNITLRQTSGGGDNPGGSGGGVINPNINYGSVTHGGRTYRTVKIGYSTWMAENLNYYGGGGSESVNYPGYDCGRRYNYYEASASCPSGWHLPNTSEWYDLELEVAGDFVNSFVQADLVPDVAGKALKARSGWRDNNNGTDDVGFGALPCGGSGGGEGVIDPGWAGFWWTSTGSCNGCGTTGAYEAIQGACLISCYDGKYPPNPWTYTKDRYTYIIADRSSTFLSVRCVQNYN
jgi:uncharacterized protein (TIGR02145 family)